MNREKMATIVRSEKTWFNKRFGSTYGSTS